MNNLCFPKEVLDQHLVLLGKTGAGKSSALRHIAEHLLDSNKRVCIIDPKGDWWGLKSSADGKHAGYPIVAFGDFKNPNAADVPINQMSGKHVAELITSGNRPCIIGFRGWMTGHMVSFWIDFASTLFNTNTGELYLIVDEVHHFAPKGKIQDPQAGKCLHWTNRLMSEGRGLGLVNLIASQRPQKVHNDALTACETLVAMRVVHKADRAAIEDWIKGCGDDRGKEVLDSVAGMKRGEAFVWSPEVNFGPTRLAFPLFKTFDSYAPPQLQKKVNERSWADVDLTEVREKLAAVIEKVKSEDPRELQRKVAEQARRITQLEADLRKSLSDRPAETKVIEKPILTQDQIIVLEDSADRIGDLIEEVKQISAGMNLQIDRLATVGSDIKEAARKPAAPLPSPPPALPPPGPEVPTRREWERSALRQIPSSAQLSRVSKAILTVLAQYPSGLSKKQILVLAGYRQSGDISKLFAAYLRDGWATFSEGRLIITTTGLDALGPFEPLPTGKGLRERIVHTASGPAERALLTVLFSAYPGSLAKGAMLEAAGYRQSGDISKMFAKWVVIGYATKVGQGQLRAADQLFE